MTVVHAPPPVVHHLRRHIGSTVTVVALTLAGVGLDLLKPWPTKLIVDHVLAHTDVPAIASWIGRLPGAGSAQGLLLWLAMGGVVVFVAAQAVRLALAYAQAGLGARLTYDVGVALFERVQQLSLLFHARRSTGDLIRRMTVDTAYVRETVLSVWLTILTSSITLALMFVVLWRLDSMLAVVALLAAPPILLFVYLFAGPLSDRAYEQQEREGELMAHAEQTLSSLPVVQAFVRESHGDRQYQKLSQRTVAAYLRAANTSLLYNVSTTSTTAAVTALILALGGWHVAEGRLTVGSLIVFLSYLAALYTPIEGLAYVGQAYASAAAHARRVRETFARPDVLADLPGARELPPPGKADGCHVRIEHLSFSYEPGRPVLRGISFEAHPGETVALVGTSGAGKTTLLLLVARLLEPSEGRILLDGLDVRNLTLRGVRDRVSFVFQEPFLMPLTVAENIACGRADARESVVDAATAARGNDFIQRLPRGYDTQLGDRGGTLSGGERQRVAIARALFADRPVLLMDEPTAALDAETEAALMSSLAATERRRTTIIVAHRLSTVQHADRICVLNEGRIAETGTHAELLKAGGLYAGLVRQLAAAPLRQP